MVLFIGTFFYITLLLTNAIAILSEERFLARIGWSALSASTPSLAPNAGFGHAPSSYDASGGSGFGEAQGVKVKLINLIAAVRTVMRIPLIGANLFIILYELALG